MFINMYKTSLFSLLIWTGFLSLFIGTKCLATKILPKPIGELQKSEVVEKYFRGKTLDLIEGIWIWGNNDYEVAILKNSFDVYKEYDYVSVITHTRNPNWTTGEIKILLKKTASERIYVITYLRGDKSEYATTIILQDDNLISFQLPSASGFGSPEQVILIRAYPSKPSSSKTSGELDTLVKTGTGFFVSKDIIATNYHVVAESKTITTSWSENKLQATLLIKDQVNDLALLKISFTGSEVGQNTIINPIMPLSVGDVRKIKDGDKVYTIGFPLTEELGKRARISEGIINSTVGYEDDPRMIQISVPVQPGNSGGPLFNVKGEVIGIVTSTVNNAYFIIQKGAFPQNINFAVKINYLNNLLSLLPTDTKPIEDINTKDISATQVMEMAKNSVVLIEAK